MKKDGIKKKWNERQQVNIKREKMEDKRKILDNKRK